MHFKKYFHIRIMYMWCTRNVKGICNKLVLRCMKIHQVLITKNTPRDMHKVIAFIQNKRTILSLQFLNSK